MGDVTARVAVSPPEADCPFRVCFGDFVPSQRQKRPRKDREKGTRKDRKNLARTERKSPGKDKKKGPGKDVLPRNPLSPGFLGDGEKT